MAPPAARPRRARQHKFLPAASRSRHSNARQGPDAARLRYSGHCGFHEATDMSNSRELPLLLARRLKRNGTPAPSNANRRPASSLARAWRSLKARVARLLIGLAARRATRRTMRELEAMHDLE